MEKMIIKTISWFCWPSSCRQKLVIGFKKLLVERYKIISSYLSSPQTQDSCTWQNICDNMVLIPWDHKGQAGALSPEFWALVTGPLSFGHYHPTPPPKDNFYFVLNVLG